MSEKVLAVLLSFGLLGGMFLWVPLLEVICPRCTRLFRLHRRDRSAEDPNDKMSVKVTEPV